ncbi:hypothetical protein J2W49_002420 [Hydrogenophaga palleronii]|uniref:Uncharacterized protein n=1 Tax=Hydrogenophaga palleronii TaxID=65655 RepID=A0ABU1WME5_9BURK|nr:hypothetical protein [Hydrogenophaga palleronii]
MDADNCPERVPDPFPLWGKVGMGAASTEASP